MGVSGGNLLYAIINIFAQRRGDKSDTTYLGYLSLRPRIEHGPYGKLSRIADRFYAAAAVAIGPIQT
jgi:hypothetical protein